ncbi:hypothetical protein E2C01_032584 [Portunus trituberculatus]|uniref:Uncharacterized protein n=1 Tax=Portunus trituberculatus TaxID=210409 RepID=A0A5B7F006_PORTR|nr:hypothetical protein [Portunus trituberculatus]
MCCQPQHHNKERSRHTSRGLVVSLTLQRSHSNVPDCADQATQSEHWQQHVCAHYFDDDHRVQGGILLPQKTRWRSPDFDGWGSKTQPRGSQ